MPTWLDRVLSWTGLRNPWAPGPTPNPWAVPSDPAATGPSFADPYHDGQWSPLIAPVLTNPAADQVRADAYVPPYTGPLDLDDYGRETDEMRRAYRDLHRTEPALRSAIDGKAAAVAALDVSVLPEDKNHPDDCQAAKFVDWTVSRSPHGWDGLILAILRPALIDGFSLAEKVLRGIDDSRQWQGFWGLKHVKARDTAHLQLRLDGYRNVLGVVNTVRGLRTYAPAKFIRFTHADLFDNPFGQSDLRAAYRAAGQIQDAYRLWYLALKRCGEPYLHGKYDHPAHRAEFEKALRALRAGGWAVTGPKDEIAVLDLAGAASFDAFERKVRLLREDIFLAVRGAYTPFMQANSGAGETRGNTAISQHGGSDPVEEVLARAVGRVLTDQFVPDLVRPNFGDRVGLPRVVLGGVNWGELRTRLDILERAKKLGLSVSARWAHETLQIPPAATPDDELGGTKPGPKPGASGDDPHSPAGLRTFSVSEAPGHPPHGRSHLVLKEIVDKNGKRTHVWVNPETGDEPPGGLLRDDLRQAQHKLVTDATGGRGTDPAKSRPTNVLIGRAQVYEWAQRFKDAGVDASFVETNRPGIVRLVLPHSAGDPAVRKKIEDLLRQTGIGARPGATGELDEAKNALFGKESDEHERVLAFDPERKEAYVLGRPIGPFQAPPAPLGAAAPDSPSKPAEDLGLSVDELFDREAEALAQEFERLLRGGRLVPIRDIPAFLGGVARGFFRDGLAGSAESLMELASMVSPIGLAIEEAKLLWRAGRAAWNDDFAGEFKKELDAVKGLNEAQQRVVRELVGYFQAQSHNRPYELSPEAQRALKYVGYLALKAGVQTLKDPELKGRVLGFIVYQVAETAVLDLATAGAAELARPGRMAAMASGLAKKLEGWGIKTGKLPELAKSLGKLEVTAQAERKAAQGAKSATTKQEAARRGLVGGYGENGTTPVKIAELLETYPPLEASHPIRIKAAQMAKEVGFDGEVIVLSGANVDRPFAGAVSNDGKRIFIFWDVVENGSARMGQAVSGRAIIAHEVGHIPQERAGWTPRDPEYWLREADASERGATLPGLTDAERAVLKADAANTKRKYYNMVSNRGRMKRLK